MSKNTNKQNILNFLQNIVFNTKDAPKADDEVSSIEAIIDFINSDITAGIADIVIARLDCNIDFHSYFKDLASVDELIALKSEDVEQYYKIVYHESVLLNIMVMAVNCPYIIVLNPENLYKSYYLQLKFN